MSGRRGREAGGSVPDDGGSPSSSGHTPAARVSSDGPPVFAIDDADQENGALLELPARSPLRSSLVKESTRRKEPSPNPTSTPKSVSFSTMPAEKKVSNVNDCLAHMMGGSDLVKVRGNTRRYRRHFTLDADSTHLRWTPTNKKPHKAKIAIETIREIRVGRNTEALRSSEACFEALQEDCAFSIIWGDAFEMLDVVAGSPEEANIWVTGLMALTAAAHPDSAALGPTSTTLRERWLAAAFAEAAGGEEELLGERDALKLIKRIAPRIAQAKILHRLKELESRRRESGAEAAGIASSEFAELYKELATRPELYFLMVRSANKDYLNPGDLQLFLETEQGMLSVTPEQCNSIIESWEPSAEGREQRLMTIDGFTAYLMSDEGSLFDPTHRAVCQDMTQPLHHYFLAASHNTYLVEDQLKGPSSALGYVRALKRGARMIEIDVWGSEESMEAVVMHGHTLTSKLPLSKALAPIRDFAFTASEYPLILKVEQHLSLTGQRGLAELLRTMLGDALYVPPPTPPPTPAPVASPESEQPPPSPPSQRQSRSRSSNDTEANGLSRWPGPEALKGKILIMSKKLPSTLSKDARDGDVSEEDESSETNKISARASRRGPSRKMRVCRELSDLVAPFLVSTHVRDLNGSGKSGSGNKSESGYAEVKSLGESVCLRLGQAYPEEVAHLATTSLARVYPNAVRVDSSNLNPQEFWNFGVQAVGLNYQTPGLMMDLAEGKFSANGGCGYVLKPPIMRDPLAHFSPRDKLPCSYTPQVLHLKVISGWQLVRPRGSTAKGDSADPYVVVEVFGVPPDCAEERTKTVKNDSFNPSWEESFQFQVSVPEVALLRFLVLDDDFIQDDFIGQYAIPFDCLQSGYRHLTLRDNEGEELENSTLLVHVAVTNRRGGGKPRKRGMSVKRRATKVQTGVKAVGVRTLDDLFKAAIVPMTESILLKGKAEAALTEWQEISGLGPAGSVRQGLRLLHSRLQSTTSDSDPPDTAADPSQAPGMEISIDEYGFPVVKSVGTAPEQLRKSFSALSDLIARNVAIRRTIDDLCNKLEEGTRRISECGAEEIGGACAEAGLRGHKATRATENFAWNLRLLRGHLESMHKTGAEATATLTHVADSACVLGLLAPPCAAQPCIHQARPNYTNV